MIEMFCIGSKKELRLKINSQEVKTAYKEFIKKFSQELKNTLIYNDCALIGWVKEGHLFNTSGQKDLKSFKKQINKLEVLK